MPNVNLLSNGSYHVALTAAGGGYSRWNDLALTRWREDPTLDPWGAFLYLRDDADGAVWSSTLKPTLQRPDAWGATFADGIARFVRRDHDIEVETRMAVSADDDVELRRVRITNPSGRRRTLCATSFAEIALNSSGADAAHPAFSKLFVETEIDPSLQTLFATRRPSTPEDATPWFFHAVRIDAVARGGLPISFETNRMRFIGRGRNAAAPRALDHGDALSNSQGPVLDPAAAIRVPFVLEAGESLTIDWLSGAAGSRDECMKLARAYRDNAAAERVLDHAGRFREKTLEALGANAAEVALYERMAAAILYRDAALRTDATTIEANDRGQSGLWAFAVSGDLPIVLLQIGDAGRIDLVDDVVRAQGFWQAFGIKTDLVVIAASTALSEQVKRSIAKSSAASRLGKPAGVFVLDDTQLDDGGRILLQSVARIVLADAGGSLAEQIDWRAADAGLQPPSLPAEPARHDETAWPQRSDLVDFNGHGGFTADAREYVITASPARMTPAPWVNIIANPDFGTLVSESGSAATWSENAQALRLTPWSNDPVGDANTEALYIRDEDSGRFWSPTLLPTLSPLPYVVRHGFGYSAFEHDEDGIASQLDVYVAIDSPVKFSVLALTNRSGRNRSLSVTGCLDWVIGEERGKTAMHVVTEVDAATGALFARNGYHTDFAGRVAFFDVDAGTDEFCADRGDFFGMGGTSAAPDALTARCTRLSGRTGAALDPCAALRVGLTLAPGESRRIVFRLGAGKSIEEARALVQRWRAPDAASAALQAVHDHWNRTLGAVQVRTPDPALNALANGWLLYQVIGSRLWGRNGFYQSSGAFGFRDQLQDSMALVHAAPSLVREHLLRAAARQFIEGDVQHWWHPPSGKGVRTTCSDDLLWLPLVACRYVETTGDASVLDETCGFLESRLLKPGEASNYEQPQVAGESASLYEHCVRAIRKSLHVGAHGLPLMGSGDWNDGMNLVGAGGKGESVWLAFFLYTVLTRFASLARQRNDAAFAETCTDEAARLRARVEASAWDGDWYLRAWFDDGSPLGSKANTECRIDSIAQSWAVLSGAADPERARRAMDALDRHLVHRDSRLVQLLDPPFDRSTPTPGYIQGYVPGVRENGGQYTHAAVWTALAFAAQGDGERAWQVFDLLNPLHHADSAEQVATYQVEPYVLAGDVYAFPPHTGRGGWSWYTGSAGWMYQLIVESLLGLKRSGTRLSVRPLLPKDWSGFEIDYRFGRSTYAIACRAADASGTTLDGAAVPEEGLTLVDDGTTHSVVVGVRREPSAAD